MPVEDHPIHPSTIRGSNHKNGCWNQPRSRNPYLVKDGFHEDGRQRFVLIDDVGSLECKNDGKVGKEGDQKYCDGCQHKNFGK